MDRTERINRLVVTPDAPRTADVARALRALTDADLVRLKSLARLWSRGLPGGLAWTDILNEAVLRVLDGARRWPPDVPLLAFMSGVMRSICDDHWRRLRRDGAWLVPSDDADDASAGEADESVPDPERLCAAAQALGRIHRLFAADALAQQIIAGLADGLTAREICRIYEMSERDYESTRKRMRRALLRCGLSWSEP